MVAWIIKFFALACLFLLSTNNVSAFYSGMPADIVVGQANFTSSSLGLTQTGLRVPDDVVVIQGKLIIADQQNDRVLIWNTIPTSNGQPADVVLGQTNFTSDTDNSGGRSASSLLKPSGLTTDGTKLIVADRNNNRVLIWNSVPTTNFAAANIVIGQSGFTGGSANQGGSAAANTLSRPDGVFFDGQRLFVGDVSNNRVLIFNSLPTSNNASADVVLGQTLFSGTSANSPSRSASSMSGPHGVYSDGTRLFVTEENNHRLLIWNTIPSTNGKAADVVVGQPNFTTGSANQGETASSNTLNTPAGLPWVYLNRLFVPDPANSRILVFNKIPTSNNASADLVIGAPDFTSVSGNTGGISARTVLEASSSYIYQDKLFVTDASNNRLLIFQNVFSPPRVSIGNITQASDSKIKISGSVKLGEKDKYLLHKLTASVNGDSFGNVSFLDSARDDGSDSSKYDYYHEFYPWINNGDSDDWLKNGYTILLKAISYNAEENSAFYFYPFKISSITRDLIQFQLPAAHWLRLKDNLDSFKIYGQKGEGLNWEIIGNRIALVDSIFDSELSKASVKVSENLLSQYTRIRLVAIDKWGNEQTSDSYELTKTKEQSLKKNLDVVELDKKNQNETSDAQVEKSTESTETVEVNPSKFDLFLQKIKSIFNLILEKLNFKK